MCKAGGVVKSFNLIKCLYDINCISSYHRECVLKFINKQQIMDSHITYQFRFFDHVQPKTIAYTEFVS